MEQAECSETLAHKIKMPGKNPEESIQHLEHGESLKSRIFSYISKKEWLHPLEGIILQLTGRGD
jgi:hypothetical protein